MMNTEMKIEYTRAGLLDMLHAGYTTVTFTKADGSVVGDTSSLKE